MATKAITRVRDNTPPAVWLLITLLIAEAFYIGIKSEGFSIPMDRLPWGLLVPAITAFCIIHSWLLLGKQRAFALLACATIISFLFEWVGETTGVIYGPYEYTEVLGWKLFGSVPVLIPFAWYMMFYPSYIIGNLLAEGGPISKRTGWVPIIWLSLLSAAVMTAWDVTMDPMMSYQGVGDPSVPDSADIGVPAWIWTNGGEFFGVPYRNSAGWMATSFTVFLVYRWWETKLPAVPWNGMCSRLMVALPIGVYTLMALVNCWLGFPGIEVLKLIVPFSMGIPAFFAAYQLFANRTDLPLWPSRDNPPVPEPARPGTGSVDEMQAQAA